MSIDVSSKEDWVVIAVEESIKILNWKTGIGIYVGSCNDHWPMVSMYLDSEERMVLKGIS